MTTVSFVTPISYRKIKNLKFTEYVLLYLDKDNKLKRAIPDFGETFMDYDKSLIEEAMKADRVAPFEIVSSKRKVTSPVFSIYTEPNGEIVNHNNLEGNITKLENFLLDSKRRQNVSKLLKKIR